MDDKFLEVAKQAALEAGKIILKYSNNHDVIIKNDSASDVVTKADIEAEKIIVKTIQVSFPNHNILAEESGSKSKNSDYTWVIDPIDGTSAFVSNIPTYSISIALLYKGQPTVSVVNIVAQNMLIWAQKGKGAFVNGKKTFVSKTSKLEESLIGFEFGKTLRRQMKLDKYFLPLVHKIRSPFALGGAATPLAYTALGMLDSYTNNGYCWDVVGGALLVEEAGGTVTDSEGNPIDWTEERIDIIASNGFIHDQILEALKQ